MTIRFTSLVPVILFILPAFVSAENVRGPLVGQLKLDSTSGVQDVTLGLDDLAAISIVGSGRFIKGIEMDLTIPAAVRQYRNLVGLYIYKNIAPTPSGKRDLYSGSRADFIVIPPTARAYVNIPMTPNSLQPSAETITVGNPIPAKEFPLIVTVLPIAKGLPSSISESKFTFRISPILEDKGLLKLNVTVGGSLPKFPYTLSIDDQQTAPSSSGYELSSGIHHLSITSDHYQEVNKTFGIDQGQSTAIDVSLKPLVPRITFEAPDNAQIFLDGQKLDGVPKKPLRVTEGEHVVIIRIGNYSLTKRFAVERGKSYKISLFLDILVREN